MRNQAYLLAACAAVAIGCGGGGGGGSKRTGTTGDPVASGGMSVNLDATGFGRVEVSYLTGEGRAEGDTYLEVTRQAIQNGDGQNTFQRESILPLRLRLPGFQTLTAGINVPFGTSVGQFDSQLLTQLVFDPNRVLVENSVGSLVEATGALPTAGTVTPTGETIPTSLSLPANLEARIRAFPGRTSLLQLRVSTATFYVDPTYGTYVFDRARFAELNNATSNTDPSGVGTLASRLSDFVRFDLSNLPATDRPNIQTGYDDSEVATNGSGYIYFSGDNVALSQSAPGGVFQEIESVSDQIVLGRWQTRKGDFPGTYSLTDANPIDLNGDVARLVALYGIYRDYTEVLSGGGSVEMVMFPNSGEQYDENRPGDLVAIVRNNGQITNMFYGGANLQTGKISLLPIFYLGVSPTYGEAGGTATNGNYPAASSLPADGNGDVGTIANYTDRNGGGATFANAAAVRRMSFTLQSPLQVPDGSGNLVTVVPSGTSGTVTVFRN